MFLGAHCFGQNSCYAVQTMILSSICQLGEFKRTSVNVCCGSLDHLWVRQKRSKPGRKERLVYWARSLTPPFAELYPEFDRTFVRLDICVLKQRFVPAF